MTVLEVLLEVEGAQEGPLVEAEMRRPAVAAARGAPAKARAPRTLCTAVVFSMRRGWTRCAKCGVAQDPTTGFLCDRPRCRYTLCATCVPSTNLAETLWCTAHRPPPARLPVVGWRVSLGLGHPGRADAPNRMEMQARFGALPPQPEQVMALSQTEESRWRVVQELRKLTTWLRSRPRSIGPKTHPGVVIVRYVHAMVRVLAEHPDPRRRVTRPSTPRTWIRRLAHALPIQARAWRLPVARILKGYASLAPAPSPTVQRDVQSAWRCAMDDAWRTFQAAPTSMAAAVWLSLELMRQGLRPRAAFRGVSEMGLRTRRSSPPVWEVRVLIDKDNPVGRQPAPRRRWVAAAPVVDAMMRALPLEPEAFGRWMEARRKVLRRYGIRQAYAARRDAAAAAESGGLDVSGLLNHRPGSMTTPIYTNTATATSLLMAMVQSSSLG